ncbi:MULTISPECIES: bifunctional phosphopantothenoylcysteine decarboxylase/phosphopantothenate--cysteine ligase CoaBC [unclassified Cobetia]|uniref:bifunctional phosphopantothenoylcysteine decarboxylase/phosphopantothenate--cysteine ligase CoaBC n=1 Tax=unclassified Cobetia TaxID=2609414 RepID=UPI002096FF5F|nr:MULTISPECIES: bifunctional phosphopantothenoylcysteine decarboxylase/phosphopantothenate--cysteine ligase CoaBC [unclassified Cobetia]MCO7233394.1 bifunctional phosphopantothenoylcysteine decarboxylase/phosphopantothenate--cysteine ligase CoaBC [Cobetia sp. Dlab-2-AX]MCO7236542.1 bifunctional phosphopantothenoylcysteine decarboxylase/phosphopantothenate--cysteine ligase CoaBC [Cobetia sp. Dlab-2-U]
MHSLAGRRILLGISGGIAAYKAALITRLLKKAGCEVRIAMTEGAQAFITPLTLQALSGNPVHTSLLDPEAEAGMGHIELARWAEVILIAPATADLMARLVHGHADDLLTTLCLANSARWVMAPAMNQAMWAHPATQRNARQLSADGWTLLGPASGEQACGDVGAGRMLEPEEIVAALADLMSQSNPGRQSNEMSLSAAGLTVTITAGPTREPLDPVRYLSNHSSGKMGYALAAEAAALGASVRLISGPVALTTPTGVERIDVESALDMQAAAEAAAGESDLFIGCAAVADFRPATVADHKLKKQSGEEQMQVTLTRNPDIIAGIAAQTQARRAAGQRAPLVIGFAAETRDVLRYARDKLARKQLDMIVANDVSTPGLGFGSDSNAATLLWQPLDQNTQHEQAIAACPKTELARAILKRALALHQHRVSLDPAIQTVTPTVTDDQEAP